MSFAAAAALVLRRLATGGHGELTLHRPAPVARPRGRRLRRWPPSSRRGTRTGRPVRRPQRHLAPGRAGSREWLARRADGRLPAAVGRRPASAGPRRVRSGSGRPSTGPPPSTPVVRPPVDPPDDPADLLDLATSGCSGTHRTVRAQDVWRPSTSGTPVGDADRAAGGAPGRRRGRLAAANDRRRRGRDVPGGRRPTCTRRPATRCAVRCVGPARATLCVPARDRYESGLPMVEEATAYLAEHGGPAAPGRAPAAAGSRAGPGRRPMAAFEAVDAALGHAAMSTGPDADPLLDAGGARCGGPSSWLRWAAPRRRPRGRRGAGTGSPLPVTPAGRGAGVPAAAHARAELADHGGAAGRVRRRRSRPPTSRDVGAAGPARPGPGAAGRRSSRPRRSTTLVEAVAGFVAEGNDGAATFAALRPGRRLPRLRGRPLDAAEVGRGGVAGAGRGWAHRMPPTGAGTCCRWSTASWTSREEALALLDQLVGEP